MNEKTPSIADVNAGAPISAAWGNSVRDAAQAGNTGGNCVTYPRGTYARPPLAIEPGNPIIAFCCGAFSVGTTSITGTVYASDTNGVAVGDLVTISIPPGDKYNTSGDAFGYAARIGGTWYLIDITCPTVDAGNLCAET